MKELGAIIFGTSSSACHEKFAQQKRYHKGLKQGESSWLLTSWKLYKYILKYSVFQSVCNET